MIRYLNDAKPFNFEARQSEELEDNEEEENGAQLTARAVLKQYRSKWAIYIC